MNKLSKLIEIIGLSFFLVLGLHAYESRQPQSRQMLASRSFAPQQEMHVGPRNLPVSSGARTVATPQDFQQRPNNTRNFQGQQANQHWNNNHGGPHQNYNYYSSPFDDFYEVVGVPYYATSAVYYSNEAGTAANTTTSESNNNNAAASNNNNQMPDGEWVTASGGNVPSNAIVYQDQNGNASYYCRATYNNQLYYGELQPNEACYAQDQSTTLRFTDYEVLVNLPE